MKPIDNNLGLNIRMGGDEFSSGTQVSIPDIGANGVNRRM
jgi:hypothetical protein